MIHGIYYSNVFLNKYKELFDLECYDMEFISFLREKSYEIIKNSNEFDEKFYVDNYPDVVELGMDPITHYLKFGASEYCNPNSFFNTKKYVESYKDNLNGLNPFIHYILYGEGVIGSEIIHEINKNESFLEIYSRILEKIDDEITIIIPIFNAYYDVKRCIESVLKYTKLKFQLILIDDNSDDPRISQLLDNFSSFSNIKVVYNNVNKGFTKSINSVINSTDNDVILLNSDTIVTPRWIQKMIISAYFDDKIATITPLSNAADISVPVLNQNNGIPYFLDINSMSLLIGNISKQGNIVSPFGNNFCMFIKREVLDDIGILDEKNFDRGFGEDKDFTVRARNNGWKNMYNDSIFIYHENNASFSFDESINLKNCHDIILLDKYPNIYDDWDNFINSNNLAKIIENIQDNIIYFNENLIKENIIYFTSINNGLPNIENVDWFYNHYNMFIITIEDFKFKLWIVRNNEFLFITDFIFDYEYVDFDYVSSYFLMLFDIFNIDSVFVNHINSIGDVMNNIFSSPLKLATMLGLSIVYGHDSFDVINSLSVKSNQ